MRNEFRGLRRLRLPPVGSVPLRDGCVNVERFNVERLDVF